MVRGQLEIERKFDVAEDFVRPDPAGLADVTAVAAPVEHALEAVYFDTPDLRLLRARITLRRRTGGPDEGWHLKLPAGSDRRELHAPLGRAKARPPKALLDVLRGVLRGAVPAPVATLATRRSVVELCGDGGQVLAEIADDTVTATVPPPSADQPAEVSAWREIEVELGAGDEALLAAAGDLLVAAGARPAAGPSKLGRVLSRRLVAVADGQPVAAATGTGNGKKKPKRKAPTALAAVLTAVRQHVGDLQDADLALRTDRDDAVHSLRIACRRLRSIFATFRHVLDRTATDPLRAELRWLAGEMGQARDDEVALAHLRELATAQPDEIVLGPVLARLDQTRISAHEEGRTRARRTLDSRRYLQLLDDLHALLADPPRGDRADRPAADELRTAMAHAGRRFKKAAKAARRAPAGEREEALHDVRRAAKRVRYTAEAGTDELGRSAEQLVRWSKKVQTVLGELQDTVITRERCRALGLAAFAAGENAFTYGRLHALEEARAGRAAAGYAELEPELRTALAEATR